MLKRQFVFDTNILVAGLRSKRGSSFRLLQMLADNRILLNVSVVTLWPSVPRLRRKLQKSSVRSA
jgi:predicted nucleic acid-binding protein